MAKTTKPKSATSYKNTAFGTLPRSKIILLEQEGVKRAQQYIIKLSEKKAQITPQLILDLHKEGFGFVFPGWAGRLRTIDVIVGEYEPPHYSRIPELVKNLCADLEERLKHLPDPKDEEKFLAELIILLAWFQHHFVWIHPLNDYNGRVARFLTNLILLNLGLPIASLKAETGRDRERYVKAMKAADRHDYSRLEGLISTALQKSFEILTRG